MEPSSYRLPHHRAFTLLELLTTIGIMGVLATIVILAIDPQEQLEDARDAQRRADLSTILNAVHQFQIDEGRLPMRNAAESITTSPTDICQRSGQSEAAMCGFRDKAFLGELVPDYLIAIPQDPENSDSWGTGYEIWRVADGRISVRAPNLRNGEGLTLSK